MSASTFERLASFENLYEAAQRARKGKRFKDAAARFHQKLAENLVRLRDELLDGTYRPGPYRTFTIYEPTRRFISAAPYRDRVVHHALCEVIEPVFERSFLFDSYANRKGKGTHLALDRCTQYARRYRYVLQGDIRKFLRTARRGTAPDVDSRAAGGCQRILTPGRRSQLAPGQSLTLFGDADWEPGNQF